MRTWSADNPKAALMERKRKAIVAAALVAFLDEGYAGSSVNRIAAGAGVSITTLYRHFDSKEDLFVAVIEDACRRSATPDEPSWFALPPREGLTEAGTELLTNMLSETQLALYRVIVRDSAHFPQLGQSYQDQIVGERIATFSRYVDRWPASLQARITDRTRAARVFAALAEAEHWQQTLSGGPKPSDQQIRAYVERAAADFLALADAGRL